MKKSLTPEFKNAVLFSILEYFLIILPVGIYTGIEACKIGKWSLLINSPEWSIATIFLVFMSVARFRQEIEKSKNNVSFLFDGFINLAALTIIIVASINAYISIDNGELLIPGIARMVIFILSTVFFFALTTSARMFYLKNAKHM